MANEYSINAKITADSTGFEKGIKSAQNSLKGFSSSISSAMKLAGSLFAVGSIAQLGKALSDMSQSYAKATQNIVRGTGAVGEQLKTLQKSVNASLINGVGRDASELGEMVADLNTRLGVTGDTLTELVSQFDDFSDVAGTDTKTAINSVSDVLAKWNIETSQTVPLLDQLTAASQASGASVAELTNGLKSGQAVFSQFGMSATESIAFLGTLKKNGIDTSSAIMGMKTALANFAKSGVDAKTAFAEISESIKNAGTQTKALSIATQTFGQRNGAEFVRILSGGADGVDAFTEALENAGGTLAKTSEASRTSADALQDLKATIAGVFATSGTDNGLRDLIDDVAKAIRNFDFTSIKETFSNIGLFIQGVWEQFKALFNNLSGAIDIEGGNFKIFADIIYQNLNNAYKVLQDFVGMVSAVLNGDWSVAWKYAKLIVLRTVKQMEESINNAIKLMPNLFNSVVEGYNWVLEQQDKLFLEIFHLPEKYFKSAKLPKYEGKDLIDTKSIEEAIEEVRKTIESKTGKIADKNLADLKKQKEAVHATTKSITGDIGSLGTAVEDMTETTGTKVSDFFAEWGKQYEDLAGNWNKTFVDMANAGTQAMGDMFTQIGEGLVNGGNSFEDYSAIAVESISKVLKALSAQLSAEAAVAAAHYDYGTAAMAAAGAAAALVAAGTLSAVASNMKKTSDAAKEASSSLEEFKKRLAEIWSGATSTSGFVSSLVQMNSVIETTRTNVEKAQRAYWDLYASQKDYVQEVWNTYFNGSLYGGWGREIYEGFYKLKKSYGELTLELEKYKEALKTLEESRGKLIQQQEESIDTTRLEIKAYEDLYSSIFKLKGVSDDYTNVLNANVKILKNEIFSKLQEEVKSLYSSLINIGSDLGKSITDGIKNGVTKSDFMETVKEYIKNKVIELVVYTDEFNSQLAEIGTKLASAIASGIPNEIAKATKQIEKLYESASTAAKKAADAIDEANKKISNSLSERVKKSIENIKETFKQKVEAIAQQAKEAAEKIKAELKAKYEETGSSLGQILVNSLVNGAKKEDFSKELGNYFKNQLVQVVIYTQEFTEKMTAFGEKIYKALMSGNQISVLKLKSEIEKYFSTKQSEIKVMSDFINSLFGLEVKENISSGADTIVENVSKIQKAIDSLKDSLKDLGGDVAGNFISSLNSGLDLDSALISFKKFIRNYVVQASVYTESLKDEFDKIGLRIWHYVSGSYPKSELNNIKKEVSSIYGNLAGSLKGVDEVLDEIFGKEAEKEVKDTGDTITKELSKIESAMDSFKKTVSDLGGDIASNLIEGLSNGLSQSDFLSNMKDWIKKMLVQSVVYTEQMKGEIEAIGKAISNAISGGFTETSMHEIRRDLSFIFEQATSKMSGIDKILGGVFDGYASGTTSALSGLHIVGERGPELVKFNGGERVYNNADTMRMIAGAGKTNNFNVTFNNLQDTSAFAMMSQLKQYNREMAINGIL